MKKALITGSSRGIGKALAFALAKQGFEVIVHAAHNTEKAKSVAEQIIGFGGKASYLSCDLCDKNQVEKFILDAGDIDVLVLNASMQIKKPWQEINEDDFSKQVACNFEASLKLIQAKVPYMKQNGWGRIITIGSVQEAKPHPDMLVYSATKAAQTNMVKSLALQLAKDGITVNNVAPGVIYTDRNMEALADPVYAKKVMDSIPVGFYGEPEDCAGIVELLCSDKGRYITGQSIYVDGGKSL